ncbi:5'-methylthioadenosine nucleosidase / S-adenosylhomocysteine nucleosidase [[Mycoplasma] phocae]|uniref:5'-methylthioadenosine nucleosidase / S-adenosylhomocysteine nucleosidase n=1 Tax=[Mycoplasma] phocae TaxID=142651 RepID=A0A2Z5IPB7_9BACT|nr:5'-methylthioadenosine/S-adenosylhomocysteine nucleosidase [[Mycoplasma] phocae]AXE60493.1 5'-methylthioadenosine nucleosidase / S-adenosylhomocysteine nucleosidase [[Mycoplasma] phocae]
MILFSFAEKMEAKIFLENNQIKKIKEHKLITKTDFQKISEYQYKDKNFLVAFTGVGKVNTALFLSYIISNFKRRIKMIINCGPAGATFNGEIGEVFLIKKTNYYDVDITALPNYELGQLPNLPVYYKTNYKPYKNLNLKEGSCATADRFAMVGDIDIVENNFKKDYYLVDMECAAYGQTATAFNKKFVAIKVISDVIKKQNPLDYREKQKIWQTSLAETLIKILEMEKSK